jgi:hypothetical protein
VRKWTRGELECNHCPRGSERVWRYHNSVTDTTHATHAFQSNTHTHAHTHAHTTRPTPHTGTPHTTQMHTTPPCETCMCFSRSGVLYRTISSLGKNPRLPPTHPSPHDPCLKVLCSLIHLCKNGDPVAEMATSFGAGAGKSLFGVLTLLGQPSVYTGVTLQETGSSHV